MSNSFGFSHSNLYYGDSLKLRPHIGWGSNSPHHLQNLSLSNKDFNFQLPLIQKIQSDSHRGLDKNYPSYAEIVFTLSYDFTPNVFLLSCKKDGSIELNELFPISPFLCSSSPTDYHFTIIHQAHGGLMMDFDASQQSFFSINSTPYVLKFILCDKCCDNKSLSYICYFVHYLYHFLICDSFCDSHSQLADKDLSQPINDYYLTKTT